MLRRHTVAALALSPAAVLAAACGDAIPPLSPGASASASFSNGRKLGQYFLQLGLAGTQVDSSADGNAAATAPEARW